MSGSQTVAIPPEKKTKPKTKPAFKHDKNWVKAKTVCRLNQEDIAMAKKLGMKPLSLIKNTPSPQQQWKAPVKLWIRNLYEKRFSKAKGEL